MYLAVTRPTVFLEPGVPIEQCIKHFDGMLSILNVQLHAFFVMGRNTEVEATGDMPPFRPEASRLETLYMV